MSFVPSDEFTSPDILTAERFIHATADNAVRIHEMRDDAQDELNAASKNVKEHEHKRISPELRARYQSVTDHWTSEVERLDGLLFAETQAVSGILDRKNSTERHEYVANTERQRSMTPPRMAAIQRPPITDPGPGRPPIRVRRSETEHVLRGRKLVL